MAGKSKKYTTLAPTYPTAPTVGGVSTHGAVGGQPGKKGMSKKQANKNSKGKMVA